MKKLLLIALLALLPSLAQAQCNGVFAANTVCGNNTVSPRTPFAIPSSTNLSGPGTTVVNDLVLWGNTSGTSLLDKAPSAFTKTDDTNVTMSLGGTPSTALVNSMSVTMGWSGTLAAARLNANVVQAFTNDTNVTASITAQNATLGWTGTLAAGRLNSNVVQAFTNDTNVTASITAQNAILGWTGQLAIARGGTGASTQAGAAASIFPTPVTTGDVVYWNGSAWVTLTGNSTGTQFLAENASGVPSWVTVSGTGTVTAITPGAGIVSSVTASCSQSNITTSGTLSKAECVNAQTGVTYTILDGDRAKLITASNIASQAYTIAQAGAASAFQAGWYVDIQNLSASGVAGAGTVTITATTSTFSSTGTTALKVYPGQTARIISDGTNYQVINITPGGGSNVLLATLTASASASLSDTTSLTSAFNDYEIVFENIIPGTTSQNLQLQVHASGAFQTTGYITQAQANNSGAASFAQVTTYIFVMSSLESAIAPGISGSCRLFGPLTAAIRNWTCFTTGVSGSTAITLMSSGFWNSATTIDGFQLLFTSGNITSGTIKVYGKK
jgi:hypothetical protein